ncbi:ATP-binding cassette domain-containing protein [Maribellus comscasis]|uniref:ATP-binding cassette domain-containing protein n=1 Tax=Maribellus comscasis TaxID=2681766 RepID=A0A6I6JWG5_9BACT|nr:ABC transporter ATP-binding protein [Maribellus comscasis]QGY46971.1 ATP-binding cassette domain-containing protein [Maribellus comscasis]
MLEINHISKKYVKGKETYTALDNVSLKIESGDFIAVVGPSGSGKSTLLHTVGGLIRPDSGQVLFRGKSVYKMDSHEVNKYRRKNVGFVFQQFHLIPYLTVYENIKLTEIELENENGSIEATLEKCALLPLKNKYPSELSVGEKQRTAFVRAIISNPEILLADEPTGNLDPGNSQILMSLIKEFRENGGTVLLVSHEAETTNYANRIVTLRAGKLL